MLTKIFKEKIYKALLLSKNSSCFTITCILLEFLENEEFAKEFVH